MNRLVCQFSCGAASAVATKLTIAKYGATHDVQIVNAFIKEEHEDNRRFLKDCEQWFGRPITVLKNTKYGASAREVWRQKRYFKGMHGAPCSTELKRKVLDAWKQPGDIAVIGYTADEIDRFEDFRERFPNVAIIAPAIDAGLTHADCLAMVERAGIELPLMYRLGYRNANCIGCCKGGEGYWNKIKRDFPDDAEEVMQIQEGIGAGSFIFRNRLSGERFSIRALPPNAGRYGDEPDISCSFFCQIAEEELAK